MIMYSAERLESRGLKYMKKKYGDEVKFTIRYSGPDLGTYDMYLTVEGHENWDVRLTWYKDDNSYRDNYMSWVLREEVERIYQPFIEQVYGDCKAYNTPYGGQVSNLYTKNTTVEEYLETANNSGFYVFVTTDQSNNEEDLKALVELLKENNLKIDIDVYYVTEVLVKGITRDNFKETVVRDKQYFCRGGYMTRKSKEDYYYKWKEGELR